MDKKIRSNAFLVEQALIVRFRQCKCHQGHGILYTLHSEYFSHTPLVVNVVLAWTFSKKSAKNSCP